MSLRLADSLGMINSVTLPQYLVRALALLMLGLVVGCGGPNSPPDNSTTGGANADPVALPGDEVAVKPTDKDPEPGPSNDVTDPESVDPPKPDPENSDPPANDPETGDPENGNDTDTDPEDPKEPLKEGTDPEDPHDFMEKDPDIAKLFPVRLPMDEFPAGAKWLNTAEPLKLKSLRGKFVVLDFWTYCCINCMHILPELKKLEHAYPETVVVIGVHSAKFDEEKDEANIAEAVLRYEIEHPVVNDPRHEIWEQYGIRSWPSLLLIDPEGKAVLLKNGEVKFEFFDEIIKKALPIYEAKGLMKPSPLKLELLADKQVETPLRFPGKLLVDPKTNLTYISDSNHNRIVVVDAENKVVEIIGTGAIGSKDGGYAEATFDHPQGMTIHDNKLYLADTENHLLRKIDLAAKTVATIAGIGEQGKTGFPGLEELAFGDDLPDRWVGEPMKTGLNSPWALWVNGDQLYIAMAGPHQIWKMPLDESEIGPYAGNGREDIVDGQLVPKEPFDDNGFSSFAQPSGLTSDGTWLFVADSEGSSIRAVPFDEKSEVRTVIGTNDLPRGRLFEFGDEDGDRETAQLQHPLGVAYGDGKIYVADTYNNKIKVVDAETGAAKTLAGTGEAGSSDDPAQFNEPSGVWLNGNKLLVADTNNHTIRQVDIETGVVTTLTFEGLAPPVKIETPNEPAEATEPEATEPEATEPEATEPEATEPEATEPEATEAEVAKEADAEKTVAEEEADPPAVPKSPNSSTKSLKEVSVKPADGNIKIAVKLELPTGWKLNKLAPMSYFVTAIDKGPVPVSAMGKTKLKKPATEFEIELPVKAVGQQELVVSTTYFYCQEADEGICKIGSIIWKIRAKIDDQGKIASIDLVHRIKD
jgi:thiol-disulfide isomerase/thioredoxin